MTLLGCASGWNPLRYCWIWIGWLVRAASVVQGWSRPKVPGHATATVSVVMCRNGQTCWSEVEEGWQPQRGRIWGRTIATTHALACSDKARQHLHGLHRDSHHNKGYQSSTRQRNPRPVTNSRVGEPSYRAQEHTGSALHATVSRRTGRLAWPPGSSRHSALSLLPKALDDIRCTHLLETREA